MAANRKLLADVEKTLKKISEGQKAFQDIFDKFNESVNQTQKEKFENELKREIKKLQRYREQIKTWQASNEIKDKRNLGDARRSIESDMERFKIIEKETKTKAYSKEGLGAEQKKDPLQKEKEDIMDWVRENISTLEKQIEKLEYDIELIIANSKKKKLDRDKQDEMDFKKDIIGKHRFHIQRLEAIMRMLDNDNLELDKVKDIKDDVEYYVANNEETDFWENYNDNIYDELELEDIGAILATSPHDSIDESTLSSSMAAAAAATAAGAAPAAAADSHLAGGAVTASTTARSTGAAAETALPLAPTQQATVVPAPTQQPPPPPMITPSQQQQLLMSSAVSNPTVPAASHQHQPPPATPISQPQAMKLHLLSTQQQQQQQMAAAAAAAVVAAAGGGSSQATNDGSDREGSTASVSEVASPSVLSGGQLKSQDLFSNLGGSANSQSSSQGGASGGSGLQSLLRLSQAGLTPQQQLIMQQQQQQAVSSILSGGDGSVSGSVEPLLQQQQRAGGIRSLAATAAAATTAQQHLLLQQQQQQQQAAAAAAAAAAGIYYGQSPADQAHPADLKQLSSQAILARQQQQQQAGIQPIVSVAGYHHPSYMAAAAAQQQQQQQQQQLQTIRLDPMSIAAPLRSQTPPRLQEALSKLENGFKKLPHAADSERFRQHTTHNPTQVPFYYPQSPPPGMDTEEFYARLDVHTLFFIFYYFEGTKAQYLAAKTLKKMSWRFHTRYLMWFQRHEEPKTITDDFEKGTYVYYDYEKTMQKRREFTFEYKYLEDKDL